MLAQHSAFVPARQGSGIVSGMSGNRAGAGAPSAVPMGLAGLGRDLRKDLGKDLGSRSDHPLHVPVLLAEVMEALQIRAGGTFIDATFGAGGYTQALVSAYETTRVLALDRDHAAVRDAAPLLAPAPPPLT